MAKKYPDRFIPFCNIDYPDVTLAKTLIEWKNDGRMSKEAFEKIERENAIRLLGL